MRVLFLPGRWQNEREHGILDHSRDLRSVLRQHGHTVHSTRYKIVDLQHDDAALADVRLTDLRADILRDWDRGEASEARVLIGYSLGASMAVSMASVLKPDAVVLIDGGLAPTPAGSSRLMPSLAAQPDSSGASSIHSPAWQSRFRNQIERRLGGAEDIPIISDGRLLDDTEVLYLGSCTYRAFPRRVVLEVNQLAEDSFMDESIASISAPILVLASTSSGRSGDRARAMFRRYRWPSAKLISVPKASHLEMICGIRMIPFWEKVGEWLGHQRA